MKWNTGLILFFLAAALCAQDQESPLTSFTAGGEDPRPTIMDRGGVLFSTVDGVVTPAWSIPSQLFSNTGPNFVEVMGADDFTIDNSVNGWQIETVQALGLYDNQGGGPAGPAESFNIYIMGHNPKTNLPDSDDVADAIFSATNVTYTDLGDDDVEIDLPGGGVFLTPGTYWLVVQAVQTGLNGQWLWSESALEPDTGLINGFESAWMQNQLLIGTACLDTWGRRITDCGVTRTPDPSPPERDLAFSLLGTPVINVVIGTPAGSQTTEDGDRLSFSVVLNDQPSDNVTLSINSSDPSEIVLSSTDGAGGDLDVVFTPLNWDQPVEVTLTGLDDAIIDGDTTVEVSFDPVVSNDPAFANLITASLMITNVDNECGREVITPGRDAQRPAFSGNGNLISFDSDADFTGENKDLNREIFFYDVQTSGFFQLTNTTGGANQNGDINGDGSLMVITSTANIAGLNPNGFNEVFLFNRGTKEVTRLTSSDTATSVNGHPQISHDGSFVCFMSTDNINGANPDGSNEVYLIDTFSLGIIAVSGAEANGIAEATGFSLSGNGERVAYTKFDGITELTLYTIGGAASRELIDMGNISSPALDASGTVLAYVSDSDPAGSNGDGNAEVFIFEGTDAMNGDFAQVTQTTGSAASQVVISPNGNRVSFVHNADLLGDNPLNLNQIYSYRRDLATTLQVSDQQAGDQFSDFATAGPVSKTAFSSDNGGPFELITTLRRTDILNSLPFWPNRTILDLLAPRCDR